MGQYQRYAIYYAPERGSDLARFGASWLGWDADIGAASQHPKVAGLPRPVDEITKRPRKYGFHGTLKPPFRLAEGTSFAGVQTALDGFAARHAPVVLDGLALSRLGNFLALTIEGQARPFADLAARIVEDFDPFRAPATAQELSRRRANGLSPQQEAMLEAWGYPYVKEEFRFHLTLTGRLDTEEVDTAASALAPHLEALTLKPFVVRELCVFGEAADGRFHILHRARLSGP